MLVKNYKIEMIKGNNSIYNIQIIYFGSCKGSIRIIEQ